MNLNDIAILNIIRYDYCCIITGISKSEAIKLLQIWLKKVEHYKTKYQEQFWSCKFTSNSNVNQKGKKYELKQNV